MPKPGLPVSDTYFDNHRLSSLCDQNCQWWDSWETSRGLAILTFLPIQHCRESHFCHLYCTHTHHCVGRQQIKHVRRAMCHQEWVLQTYWGTGSLEECFVLTNVSCRNLSVNVFLNCTLCDCFCLSRVFCSFLFLKMCRAIRWGHFLTFCPSKNCRISAAQTVECGTSNSKVICLISWKYIN